MHHLGSGNDGSQTVNIVFSKGEQRIRTLLEKDGLVLSHNMYPPGPGTEKFNALLFNCVTEDTDGNRRLDGEDRSDLYVVAEALDRPDIVVKGVLEYRMISPTHLAVKTRENGEIRFRDIDTETGVEKAIVWR